MAGVQAATPDLPAANPRVPLGPLGAEAELITREGESQDAWQRKALRVTRVSPGPAQRAGLQPGDVLLSPEPKDGQPGTPLRRFMLFLHGAQAAAGGKDGLVSVPLRIKRGEREETLPLQLPVLAPHAKECPHGCAACQTLLAGSLDWLAAQCKGYRAPRAFDQFNRGPFYVGRASGGQVVVTARAYTVAVTAVAGLAFLAAGESPKQGPHAEALAGCREYVAMAVQTWRLTPAEAGGLVEQNFENWALGYAGLFLGECLAREPADPALRKTLAWVAERLGANQEPSGGWGHEPHKTNNLGYRELAAPGLIALPALGVLKAQGLAVPEKELALGVQYLLKLQEGNGGLAYSHEKTGLSQVGRTGGFLWALALSGNARESLAWKRAEAFLLAHPEHALYGHGSALMNLVWSGWGAQVLGAQAQEKLWAAHHYLVWAARRPDGSFAPLHRQEIAYMGKQGVPIAAPKDGDSEQYLGIGEGKAVAVWIASHHLIFWQTPLGKLSWMAGTGVKR